jgi:hypothetical protein
LTTAPTSICGSPTFLLYDCNILRPSPCVGWVSPPHVNLLPKNLGSFTPVFVTKK